jgi:hypothetical protein
VDQYSESDHVSKLGERLGDEDFRNSFKSDPSQALSDAGIDEEGLPDGVLEALRHCQPEELKAVAKVRGAPMDAGVEARYRSDIV